MSYCTVYVIDAAGDVGFMGRAQNNHGFAPHVWSVLAKKSGLPDPFMAKDEEQKRFWGLFNSGKLSERDNLVLGATYDRVYIAKANLRKVADAIRSFYEEHSWVEPDPTKPWLSRERYQIVGTMMGVATILDKIAADETSLGACFNLCSANENPWLVSWSEFTQEEKTKEIAAWREANVTVTEGHFQYVGDNGHAYEVRNGPSNPDLNPEDLEAYGPPNFEPRPFNFKTDIGKKRVHGGDPWEILDVAGYAASESQ